MVRGRSAARFAVGFLGAALLASAVLLGVTAVPAPASGRAVVVDAADGLVNQVVRVSWSGFTPTSGSGNNAVVVLQCRQAPTSLADCFNGEPYPSVAEGTRQIAVTAADGTGSTLFEVRPAAQLPLLGCSASVPCSILVYENDGVPVPAGALPTSAVVAPISFAPSQADCPEVSDFDLRVDGEASAAPLFYRWAAQRCTGSSPLVIDFTETSSNEGRENYLAGLVDFGVTSVEARAEELAEHPEAGPFSYAPVDLTAVTVVLNMRDPFTGRRLEDVVLTPRLVAMLVTDSDVTRLLSDPELRQLNPGVRFPTVALSHPLVRAERNADTALVTTMIAKDPGAAAFLAGDDAYGARINPDYRGYSYPRDLFENVAQSAQFLPRAGQNQVALRMFYAVRPTGSTSERTDEIGFIGIVDLPTARRFGLPTARIVNAAGEAVAPTDEAILAGYRAMKASPTAVLSADTRAAAADAYPLVKVDYAMVPKEPASDAKRAAMRSMLEYIAGEGQSSLPPGYVPLPEALRKQTRDVAAGLAKVEPPVPTPTTTVPGPVELPFEEYGDFGDPGRFPDVPSGFADGGLAGGADLAEGAPADAAARAAADSGAEAPTAAAADLPELPPLPVGPSRLLAPAVLGLTGVGMLGWSTAGIGPRLRRGRLLPVGRVAS